jgi:hypothetical protein
VIEVTVARFKFLHEAEYAQGFLDEAGIRCLLKPDNAAGGAPYIGGLAGAALVVAAADLDQSLEVLRIAGVLGEDTESLKALRTELEALRSLSPALRADLADVELALDRARKKEVRHFVWAMFGVSPAALIPFLGLALEGEGALLALLCVMVVTVEGWRWSKARGEVRSLEVMLVELREEAEQEPGP